MDGEEARHGVIAPNPALALVGPVVLLISGVLQGRRRASESIVSGLRCGPFASLARESWRNGFAPRPPSPRHGHDSPCIGLDGRAIAFAAADLYAVGGSFSQTDALLMGLGALPVVAFGMFVIRSRDPLDN